MCMIHVGQWNLGEINDECKWVELVKNCRNTNSVFLGILELGEKDVIKIMHKLWQGVIVYF